MTNMMRWYEADSINGGAGKKKDQTNFVKAQHDYDRRIIQYYRDSLDCSYPTTSTAYTAASGFPVGDLNWFPDKKAEWVGIRREDPASPVSFSLKQNYPNPFNPTTQIVFELNKSGFTSLSIYNLLGQIVATPVSKHLSAGSYTINFDASHLAGGMYFYKLESAGQKNVRKMLLLK